MKLEKDKILIIITSVLVLIFGVLYFIELNRSPVVLSRPAAADSLQETTAAIENNEVPLIMVHVVGAVKSPGVYELEIGSRVQDAVNLAGGPSEEADMSRINLAAYISDAQQIVVPRMLAEGEVDDLPVSGSSSGPGLVNINTADIRELMTLPGIGQVIAGNIIAHRERNGNFRQIEDIKNVTRIGERTFEQIKDMITVN